MASHLQPTENDPPSKSPPEPSQEELKIKTLESKIAKLNDEISIVKSRISEAYAQLTELSPAAVDNPSVVVQRHIRLLHGYNEIKDIGQGLMGIIADSRGMRYVDVQTDFGITEKD